jgi:hypothetical protein
METLIDALLKSVGSSTVTFWVLVGVVIAFFIDRTGILKHWAAEHSARRTVESEMLLKERTQLFEELRKDVERLREENARVEERNNRLVETVASQERGNSRLRHMIFNDHQYIDALRSKFKQVGLPPPPYERWRDAMKLDPALADRLRDFYREDMIAAGIDPDNGDQSC